MLAGLLEKLTADEPDPLVECHIVGRHRLTGIESGGDFESGHWLGKYKHGVESTSMSDGGHDQPQTTWTTRRLLKWTTDHFKAGGIDSPRVVAEMLLAHVIGCERMRLYMEIDRPATPLERATLRDLVARAARNEPVQYLVGHAWFFGRAFAVNPSVLIPRPCTETLLECVLQWHRTAPGHAQPRIADIGTGCGCIAISLAVGISDAHLVATDVDEAALAVARKNAARHGVADRIDFCLGAGLGPLEHAAGEGRFDAICSNPPYICDEEWAQLSPNVRCYEPATALRAGPEGLDVIRPILISAGEHLRPQGRLFLEIAHSHRDAVVRIAEEARWPSNHTVSKDHEGLWRLFVAERE